MLLGDATVDSFVTLYKAIFVGGAKNRRKHVQQDPRAMSYVPLSKPFQTQKTSKFVHMHA